MSKLLTSREAAELAGMTLSTFYTISSVEGGPEGALQHGGFKRYEKDKVIAWARKREERIKNALHKGGRKNEGRNERFHLVVSREDLHRWKEEAEKRDLPVSRLITFAMRQYLK